MPRVPTSLVVRDRLFTHLAAHPDAAVVVLRAPAGGGKTTLLVDWLARSPRPGAWVTIDPNDGGRLAFWMRVADALVRSDALAPDSVLHEVASSEDLGESPRSTVLSGLSGVTGPIVLVLDDFQHVQDPLVAEDLIWLLSAGAPLDLVVASRTVTVFEHPEQRARVDTLVLDTQDLAFDADEALSAGRAAGISDDDALAIHDASGGLPLAVRATILDRVAHPEWPVSRALERMQGHGAAHLLTDDTDPAYREFLLRLSVARTAHEGLIGLLTGEDTRDLLLRAERDGVGSWSDAPDGPMFVLQPYVRAHLLAELRRTLPQEEARLEGIYGNDLAARGDFIGAIRHLARAGAWDAATRTLLAGYHDLIRVHADELAGVLAAAGSAVLRRHPLLLVCLLFIDNARKALPRTTLMHKANLGVALLQARLGGGDPRDRAPLLVALLGMQRLGGHYDSAVDTADRLMALLATFEDNGKDALLSLLPNAFVQAGTTYFYAQVPDRADGLLRVASEIAVGADRPWVELHATSMRLLLQATRGRVEPHALAAARERTRPLNWRGTYSAAGYHLAEAYEALEVFDSAAARAHLDELSPHEHTIEHWPMIARLRALAALVEGRAYLGLEQLSADVAAHGDRPPTSRAMSTVLAVARADLLLAEGEPHRAEAALKQERRAPSSTLARGRIHLALGRHEQAIAEVAEFAWSERSLPRPKAEALLTTAVATATLGRHDDTRVAVNRALDLLAEAGLRRPLMMVRRHEIAEALTIAGRDAATVLDGVPDVFSREDVAAALTSSELRVLEELRLSRSTEDIANALFLSVNTVKSHQRTIYRKLDVRTRDAALAVAALRGILPSGPVNPNREERGRGKD